MPMAAAVVRPVLVDDRVVDFVIVDTNAAADREFRAGVPGSAVGHELRQLMPWIEDAGVWDLYHEVVESGRPVMQRGFTLRPPGTSEASWWDMTILPLGREVLVVFNDVTAEWRHQQQSLDDVLFARVSIERLRMARDLHDTVIQDVIGAALALARIASTSPPAVSAQLAAIIDAHDDIVRQLRTVLFDLNTGTGRDPANEIAAVAATATVALGFAPSVTIGRMSDGSRVAFPAYQMAFVLREILSNIARHAHAGRVDITVEETNGHLVLRVVDDGVGFDPQVRQGRGLDNIEHRMRSLGGHVRFISSADRGTRVECHVPVPGASLSHVA